MAVRAGLTALMLGKTLVSATYRLSTSCARQSALSTELAGSLPNRTVPAGCAQPKIATARCAQASIAYGTRRDLGYETSDGAQLP